MYNYVVINVPVDSVGTFADTGVIMVNRKCQDYVYVKEEYQSTMQKMKHYLRDMKIM